MTNYFDQRGNLIDRVPVKKNGPIETVSTPPFRVLATRLEFERTAKPVQPTSSLTTSPWTSVSR